MFEALPRPRTIPKAIAHRPFAAAGAFLAPPSIPLHRRPRFPQGTPRRPSCTRCAPSSQRRHGRQIGLPVWQAQICLPMQKPAPRQGRHCVYSAKLPPTSASENGDSSVSRGEAGAECHALIRSNNSSIASTSQRWPAGGSGGSSTGAERWQCFTSCGALPVGLSLFNSSGGYTTPPPRLFPIALIMSKKCSYATILPGHGLFLITHSSLLCSILGVSVVSFRFQSQTFIMAFIRTIIV